MDNTALPHTSLPVVVDMAAVTSLSNTPEGLWREMASGNSAITPVGRFSTAPYTSRMAACIPDLNPSGPESMIHHLVDRLFHGWPPLPPDTYIITASTKAGIDNLEKARRGRPADCRDIYLSTLVETVSRKVGLSPGGLNISAACASGAIALARAAAMIASGRRDCILVCCLDVVTEFVFSGFSALRALSPEACRPFDNDRKGLTLGEGAAALLLMSPERAHQDGCVQLGRILGWGIANDAVHITAPARDGRGLVQAVQSALQLSGIHPSRISAISAHGTGTVYNDLMEMVAFQKVFSGRRVPTFSPKGAIGHTLGAAGAIEAILGFQSLEAGEVPPTVGLTSPMPEAAGMVSPGPAPFSGEFVLSTNSGFGGINAALVLGRGVAP